jgi:hypothetical protein
VAEHLESARADILAFAAFPKEVWLPRPRHARPIRSGARHRPRPCRVVCRRLLRRRAASPSSRISAATVFSLTRHPASRSDPGRSVGAAMRREQPVDLHFQLCPAGMPW